MLVNATRCIVGIFFLYCPLCLKHCYKTDIMKVLVLSINNKKNQHCRQFVYYELFLLFVFLSTFFSE